MSLSVHGVVARWELLAAGFGAGAIDVYLRSGTLWPVHRGVYAVGRPEIGRLGRWRAAVIACGPEAWLSHRDAAALLGLLADERRRIDVTVTRRGTQRAEGLDIHVTRWLDGRDTAVVQGIPCTGSERTLLDLADVVSSRALEAAAEVAYRERLLRVEYLHRQLNAVGRRRRKLARALRVEVRRTRSPLEDRFLAMVEAAGLPAPLVNVWMPAQAVECDAVWPDARLIVEIDSRFHDTPHARERDARKDEALRAAGWIVLRVRARDFASFIASELAPRLAAAAGTS